MYISESMYCVITALLCVTSAYNPKTVISPPTKFDTEFLYVNINEILFYYEKEYIGMCSWHGLNYLQLNRGTSPISGVFNTQDTNALNVSEVSKILPNITCPIVLDRYTFLGKFNMFMSSIKVDDASWECLLLAEFVCDGRAQCLTDECGCGSDVFFCATHSRAVYPSRSCVTARRTVGTKVTNACVKDLFACIAQEQSKIFKSACRNWVIVMMNYIIEIIV